MWKWKRNRVSAGVPEGGQWASEVRGEPEAVGLSSAEDVSDLYRDDPDVQRAVIRDDELVVTRTVDTSGFSRDLQATIAHNPRLATHASANANPRARVDENGRHQTRTPIRPGQSADEAVRDEKAAHAYANTTISERDISDTYRDFGYAPSAVVARVDSTSARVQGILDRALTTSRPVARDDDAGPHAEMLGRMLAAPRRGRMDSARARENVTLALAQHDFEPVPPREGQPESVDVFYRRRDNVWLATDAARTQPENPYSTDATTGRRQEAERVNTEIRRAWQRRGISAGDAVQRAETDDTARHDVPASEFCSPMSAQVSFGDEVTNSHGRFALDTSDGTPHLRPGGDPQF